jgi:hypothetical protein
VEIGKGAFMSANPILYLGDTSLSAAAGYLAGLMTSFGFRYDYRASDQRLDPADAKQPRKLIILSDYSSKMLDKPAQAYLVDQVKGGSGLLMIGGWESYCGLGGDWSGTALGNALPVNIAATDDRLNCDQPALAREFAAHPITRGLPWHLRPPTIGGLNRVALKKDATLLLEVERFEARYEASGCTFKSVDRHVLLAVGSYGQGRTAALTTDLAPHWVGGFVDWGPKRVTATAPGSWSIEVGSDYAAFIRQLLTWTGNL